MDNNNIYIRVAVKHLFAVLVMVLTVKPATAQEPNADRSGPSKVEQSHIGKSIEEDYVIGKDDILDINVWKEPEISRTVAVRPDGKITLPLMGDIAAEGLTSQQLQLKITQGLETFLSKPEVTVIVKEVRSQKFNVIGQVLRPGSYNLIRPATVLDALSLAGGFRDFAKEDKIYVLRRLENGRTVRMPFNYKAVIKGKHTDQLFELQPKDTVIVP